MAAPVMALAAGFFSRNFWGNTRTDLKQENSWQLKYRRKKEKKKIYCLSIMQVPPLNLVTG